jgi:hypothetical protein
MEAGKNIGRGARTIRFAARVSEAPRSCSSPVSLPIPNFMAHSAPVVAQEASTWANRRKSLR